MIPKMQTERSDFPTERSSLPSCPFSSPSPGDPGAGAGRRLFALRPQRPGKSRGQPPARLEARARVRPRPGAAQRLFRRGHAGGIGSLHTDRELEHDSVVGREGIKGPLLDLNADVCDARVGCGAELTVCGGGNAQPVAGCKLDFLTVDRD